MREINCSKCPFSPDVENKPEPRQEGLSVPEDKRLCVLAGGFCELIRQINNTRLPDGRKELVEFLVEKRSERIA